MLQQDIIILLELSCNTIARKTKKNFWICQQNPIIMVLPFKWNQASVVQKLDSTIQQINHYPANKY